MSVHINWRELVSSPSVVGELRDHLARLIEEKVNTKQPGEIDDGTRVHLLELHLGEEEEPPVVELLRLGMDEENGTTTTVAATAPEETNELETGSPTHSGLDSPPRPSHHSVRTPSPGSASYLSTPRSHASSAAASAASRCAHCSGRVPVSALPLPSVSLRGRVAYTGSAYVTVQIRRQVNPLVTKRGLIGRLGRAHHATAAMNEPLDVELWVRVGEISFACDIQLTYLPEQKASPPPASHRTPAASPTTPRPIAASPSPQPNHTNFRSHTPSSRLSSPFPSPAPAVPSSAVCTCPSSSSSRGLSSAASAGMVSVLLESNPLHHLGITSSLDGSAAGVKLRTVMESQLAAALKKVVGQRIDIPLPKKK